MGAFFYPTGVSYTGYSGLASYMAGRLGNVTGYSGMAAPASPTGNDGFLQAIADSILGTVAFQAQSDVAGLGTATQGTSTFADVGNGSSTGFSTYTFSAPKAGIYVVHVHLSAFMTVSSDTLSFRLQKDGNTVFDSPAARLTYNVTGQHLRLSFCCPVFMASGNNVLKLQWKTSGIGTATVDTGDFRCFTVTG